MAKTWIITGASAGGIGEGIASEIVTTYLTTEFEGGRHERRVDLITALENE